MTGKVFWEMKWVENRWYGLKIGGIEATWSCEPFWRSSLRKNGPPGPFFPHIPARTLPSAPPDTLRIHRHWRPILVSKEDPGSMKVDTPAMVMVSCRATPGCQFDGLKNITFVKPLAYWKPRQDIDGDGRPEIVLATRSIGGKTRIDVFDDAIGGFARLTEHSVVVTGPAGAGMFLLRPGLADIDGDGRLEIALGFPASEAAEGALQVLDDVETGFAPYLWTGDLDGQIAVPASANGVWPAIGADSRR